MDVSKQEIEAVIKLSPEKRYTYFIKRICDWELIWTLYEDDSIILNEGKNGELYIILFPFIDFASYYVTKTKEMSGSLCKSFELEEFLNTTLAQVYHPLSPNLTVTVLFSFFLWALCPTNFILFEW